MRFRLSSLIWLGAVGAALLVGASGYAQDSDFNLNMHANGHATAKEIGLPVYPGATLFRESLSLIHI